MFAKHGDDWRRFHKAARALKGQSGTQSFAYGETFAGEGGMVRAGNGRVAGIDKKFFDEIRVARDRNGSLLVPDLANVRTPSDLTVEQVVAIYRFYADKSFDTVGGSAALDKVGDPYAAAALHDTMFREGAGGGAGTVQQAINDVLGSGTVPEDGQMGPATLDAYAKLAQNPDTRAALLDALARKRTAWEADPRHRTNPDPARIEHFRYVGTRD